ncbi:thiamine-phosphate kinase [Stakelama saccharophila]|uniref:Thiamine-monophosphate kinase n=1 Tax=Stakelama saccharophila TaxID=3075605 RepID=A0ABZ0B822_9SPHN|nr:thiamine-phosphate kinase [Stakelama sp. W311]WNO53397.1 thiamine-phosphate kinase [Stakelama sp. W311]
MTEADFIAALRDLPLHPAARGLVDDAAVLDAGPGLVLTKDMIAEGVHFLPGDPPGDVAWKLLAVNLSDLAAKGAAPIGVMLGYPLSDTGWDRAFLDGLGKAMRRFGCPLIGGDTIALPPGAPRTLSLTALGQTDRAPARGGACAGDALWVTGTIGDGGAGLAIAGGAAGPEALLRRYRRPVPRIAEGQALAHLAGAVMDVSDGLVIDARRMAAASGLAVTIDLSRIPLSAELKAFSGEDRAARLAAATAGDDYELLFALPAGAAPPVAATRIGRFGEGGGISLTDGADPVPVPGRAGFEHRA